MCCGLSVFLSLAHGCSVQFFPAGEITRWTQQTVNRKSQRFSAWGSPPFWGLNSRYPAYQIFTLRFIIVRFYSTIPNSSKITIIFNIINKSFITIYIKCFISQGNDSTLVCMYCSFGSHCMSSGSTERHELGSEKRNLCSTIQGPAAPDTTRVH